MAGVRRGLEQLRWGVLAIAALVGIAVVALVWWFGPGLFGSPHDEQEQVVQATVTLPAPCALEGAQETVHFEVQGTSGNGLLSACGHRRGEQLAITAPSGGTSGLPQVRTADTVEGHSDLRRPVGLGLVALSCLGGGVYAFLVARGPRRHTALI